MHFQCYQYSSLERDHTTFRQLNENWEFVNIDKEPQTHQKTINHTYLDFQFNCKGRSVVTATIRSWSGWRVGGWGGRGRGTMSPQFWWRYSYLLPLSTNDGRVLGFSESIQPRFECIYLNFQLQAQQKSRCIIQAQNHFTRLSMSIHATIHKAIYIPSATDKSKVGLDKSKNTNYASQAWCSLYEN